MTEIRTVTTLRSKRAEIISSIANYEKRLAQARADLSHVNACIALFEVTAEAGAVPPHVDTHHMFARVELCRSVAARIKDPAAQSLSLFPLTQRSRQAAHADDT